MGEQGGKPTKAGFDRLSATFELPPLASDDEASELLTDRLSRASRIPAGFWWAAASLPVIFAGAFGPWTKTSGLTVDGSGDETVVFVAVAAAVALVAFFLTRRRGLLLVAIAAGLVSLTVVGRNLQDPLGPFGGREPNIHLEWGIWLAFAGSVGLVLTTTWLLAATARALVQGKGVIGESRRLTLAASSSAVRRIAARARRRALTSLDDEAVLRDFAGRLNSSDERATTLLAGLVEQMHRKPAGTLLEGITPIRALDYSRHRVELRVSSAYVWKRLGSVEKEPFTVEWIERSLKPGEVFYDIGANVGPYALIAAKVTGNRARVLAFEPVASSFHDLSRNVLLNDCQASVVPLPLALWSENKLLLLQLRSPEAGAARHRIGTELDPEQQLTEVILGVRLDDLVERFDLPVPTHAKIDVDGCELEVLEGAKRTLAQPQWRSIMIELDQADTARNRAIKALLRGAGFDSARHHRHPPTRRCPNPSRRSVAYWTFTRRVD